MNETGSSEDYAADWEALDECKRENERLHKRVDELTRMIANLVHDNVKLRQQKAQHDF